MTSSPAATFSPQFASFLPRPGSIRACSIGWNGDGGSRGGLPDSVTTACAERLPGPDRCELEGIMDDIDTRERAPSYQVLFPVAVGAVFLVVLVVGAIVGS